MKKDPTIAFLALFVTFSLAIPGSVRADSWSSVGSGLNNPVRAIAFDSGNLYAGGDFITAGGMAVNRVAKWDGAAWSALGSGMNARVEALVWDDAGTLYAGGDFTTADGVAASYVAKWNGASWSALGSGMNDSVYALVFDDAGNLYAGGLFTTAGGVPANGIAMWDGTSWSAVGHGLDDGEQNFRVYALAVDDAGNLYAGEDFFRPGGIPVSRVAMWDGTSWSTLGHEMSSTICALTVDDAGNPYAGGFFTSVGGVPAIHVAKWNGTVWSALGAGLNDIVYALAFDAASNLYAGGVNAGFLSDTSITTWNGTAWSAAEFEMNDQVFALVFTDTGDLYAGGQFTTADGVPANYIAQFRVAKMVVRGNGMVIEDGDSTPGPDDGTDFGAGNSVVRTFTIENIGTDPLLLTRWPRLEIFGAADYTLSSALPGSQIAPGGSETFQVTFDPQAGEVKHAVVCIPNNDVDRNPYTFAIRGGSAIPVDTSQSISLMSPNGGESWEAGSEQWIVWNPHNVTVGRIEYSMNGGSSWSVIEPNATMAYGSFLWTVPQGASLDCLVRIVSTTPAGTTAVSAQPFAITGTAPVRVTDLSIVPAPSSKSAAAAVAPGPYLILADRAAHGAVRDV
ncbi:MAG: choice-of-anchor D domain-containing protein, partial [Kiritimatiellia bacterium]|nr:choice-of-anchor D domain-containing protein [Kiritimatiellia bacterium]